MVRDRAHHRLRRITASGAKLLFAAGVFFAMVGGYFYLTTTARLRMPLPDKRVSNGRCVLWLVGSSSMHRWKTAGVDLGGWQVHNRGVEGARLPELQQRLALNEAAAQPDAILLYAGENDLADEESVTVVLANLKGVAATLVRDTPDAKLFIISMKPSPGRWANRPAQVALNAGLHQFAHGRSGTSVIDAGDLLLTDGQPGNYYQEDGIHLSSAGYARWGSEIERQLNVGFKGLPTRCGPK